MSTVKKNIDYSKIVEKILPEIYELTKLGYWDGIKAITYEKWFFELFDKTSYKENWNQFLSIEMDYYYYKSKGWFSSFILLWFYLHFDQRHLFAYSEYDFQPDQREDALKLVKTLIKHESAINNPHFLYCLGIYHTLTKNYPESERNFNEAYKYFGDKAPITFYCDWGKVLYELKDYKSGDSKFEIASNIAPDKWWIYDSWADSLFKFNKTDKLSEMEAKALSLNTPDPQLYENMAFRTILSNIEYDELLIEITPYLMRHKIAIPDHYKRVCKRLLDKKEYYKAKEAIQEALTNNPNCPELNSYLAKTYYYTMDEDLAIEKFKLSYELDYKNILQLLDKEHFEMWKKLIERIYYINPEDQQIALAFISSIKAYRKNDPQLSKYREYKQWAIELAEDGEYRQAIRVLVEFLNKVKKGSFMQIKDSWKLIDEYVLHLDEVMISSIQDDIKNAKLLKPIQIIDEEHLGSTQFLCHGIITEIIKDSRINFPALMDLIGISNVEIPSDTKKPNNQLIKDKIVLTPKHRIGNKHKNEIIYVNNDGEANKKQGAGNSPFDLLYYLGWLKNNSKVGIEKGAVLTDKQKSKLCPNHSKHKRFDSVWANGDKDQLDKMKSIINKYFDFELIIIKNSKFSINDGLIIDLKPYPSK